MSYETIPFHLDAFNGAGNTNANCFFSVETASSIDNSDHQLSSWQTKKEDLLRSSLWSMEEEEEEEEF